MPADYARRRRVGADSGTGVRLPPLHHPHSAERAPRTRGARFAVLGEYRMHPQHPGTDPADHALMPPVRRYRWPGGLSVGGPAGADPLRTLPLCFIRQQDRSGHTDTVPHPTAVVLRRKDRAAAASGRNGQELPRILRSRGGGVFLAVSGDSVQLNALDERAQLLMSVEPAPAFLRAHRGLEDHCERAPCVTQSAGNPEFGPVVLDRAAAGCLRVVE